MNIQKRNLKLTLIVLAFVAIVITAVFAMPAEQIAFADTAGSDSYVSVDAGGGLPQMTVI